MFYATMYALIQVYSPYALLFGAAFLVACVFWAVLGMVMTLITSAVDL